MASSSVVEVDAGADGAALLAASRTLSTQTWRALVPLARHGNESAAAGAGIMSATLDQSYAFCRKIAHQYGANFSVGFRFLPRQKRRAVYAAYAFCRWADDIADEDGGLKPAATLDDWQRELDGCYGGHPSHPITIALGDALRFFNIPKSAFMALIDGCRLLRRLAFGRSLGSFPEAARVTSRSASRGTIRPRGASRRTCAAPCACYLLDASDTTRSDLRHAS